MLIVVKDVQECQKAIIRTLAYADVFDYPLTEDEIWKFLIVQKSFSRKYFEHSLPNIKNVQKKEGYYFFSGRKSIVKKRKIREKESKRKLQIVGKIASLLKIIPSVNLIGVSGNLAMRNADKNDDIDLFVVTKARALWTTRILIILLLKIFGKHRGKSSKKITDKICINMLLDEYSLNLPKDKQNLYTAHEVVQMMPVFERGDSHLRFINANIWVKEYLPNSITHRSTRIVKRINTDSFFSVVLRLVLRFSAIEILAKRFQLWYMHKHFSTEHISDYMLAFHPKDYTQVVLRMYNKSVKKYGAI